MSKLTIPGIHHITAIASDPQRNLDFYTKLLGLRLVKLTVNFDDPGTYHFYFGDEQGQPGTILTFFPWPNARRGQSGNGQVGTIAFSIPAGSLEFWQKRLRHSQVEFSQASRSLDGEYLTLQDPDGIALELLVDPGAASQPAWEGGPLPVEHAIRGFHSAGLLEADFEPTADLLTDSFGFRLVDEDGSRFRFRAGEGGPGKLVDLIHRPKGQHGRMGAGAVHHIAWRTPDDEQQLAWRDELIRQGYNLTPVMDRQYFHSIYFREHGGVLFEIATDAPGFAWDEPLERLGSGVKLPPWLEPSRQAIQDILPPLKLPGEKVAAA